MGILQEELEGDVGSVPRCQTCGAERVVREAWACWNRESGLWELEHVLETARCCGDCDGPTTLVWSRPAPIPQVRVRELNDQFRRTGMGPGTILVTTGVQAEGEDFVQAVLAEVRRFDAFTPDNDPWGEHDFGTLDLAGQKIFWKIDCYDPTRTQGSKNPANAARTHRVLTIMLASEY